MKEEILRLRAEGKSYSQIQKELGCSPGTISYHCNALSKEKAKLRSKNRIREKCKCGNFKKNEAELCIRCYREGIKIKKRDQINNSTIADYLKLNPSNKYASIRRLARVFMEEQKIEKKCKLCNFSPYVEVCHIKPISSFSKETKISVVNHLTNLVYLCPNHHILLDSGVINL